MISFRQVMYSFSGSMKDLRGPLGRQVFEVFLFTPIITWGLSFYRGDFTIAQPKLHPPLFLEFSFLHSFSSSLSYSWRIHYRVSWPTVGWIWLLFCSTSLDVLQTFLCFHFGLQVARMIRLTSLSALVRVQCERFSASLDNTHSNRGILQRREGPGTPNDRVV